MKAIVRTSIVHAPETGRNEGQPTEGDVTGTGMYTGLTSTGPTDDAACGPSTEQASIRIRRGDDRLDGLYILYIVDVPPNLDKVACFLLSSLLDRVRGGSCPETFFRSVQLL
jgi:hypothetical protein